MGKLLFWILMIYVQLISIEITAQVLTLPDSNAFWEVEYFDGPTYLYSDYYCMNSIQDDTLINDTAYSKLYACNSTGQSLGFFGGIFNEGNLGKVYFYYPDHNRSYLLYDFDVVVGDTLIGLFSAISPIIISDTVYVTEVDSIEISGQWRRKVLTNNDGQWIAGIGSPCGLLTPFSCITLSIWTRLFCMSANDTTWWSWGPIGDPGNCFTSGTADLQIQGTQPVIFQNHIDASGVFIIDHTRKIDIEVFNSTGALVLQTNGLGFDISHQPPGIYIVRLRGKAFVWSQKVVR